MRDRDAHRKARARHLIETDYGRPADFVRATGIPKARVSQAVGASEPFGEDAAQTWEQSIKLPAGWFSNTWPTPNEARKKGWRVDAPYPPDPGDGEDPSSISLEGNPDYPAIRRVRFKLSAGASGFGVEYIEDDDAPIVFRRQWFVNNGYNPKKLFAVKVCNGSMETGLYHGDTVVVNTEQTTPKDGVVFAVNYEGEPVIKRLMRDDGQWWLCSDNPDHRRYPRKVCGEDVFLIGEVVLKQSKKI